MIKVSSINEYLSNCKLQDLPGLISARNEYSAVLSMGMGTNCFGGDGSHFGVGSNRAMEACDLCHYRIRHRSRFCHPLENLVACCVVCNSSKGKRQRNLLPQSFDKSWDGGSSIFLTLAPIYRIHLSHEDKKWLKALRREGITPDDEDIQAKIDMMSL
jgi:hypothetical protein